MSKKKAAIIAGALICVLMGSLVTLRRVQDAPSDAQLLWDSNHAYLFIGLNRLGVRALLGVAALPLLRLAPFGLGAQDQRHSIVVFHVTPDRVNRYVAEDMVMEPLGVVNGRISSALWRWNGDHFERASLDEVQDLRRDPEFSDLNGWSKRSLLPGETTGQGRNVSLSLAGRSVALTIHRKPQESLTIDLQRGGAAPERLWSHDERSRFVSRSKYNELFER